MWNLYFFFTPSFPRRKVNILHYTNFSSQDNFFCVENNQNKKLQLLFISIDPKDKMEVMKKYVEYFNKDFIGMTMDDNNLDELIKKTGVYVKKVSSEGDIDFYDHTGAIFIVNSDAKVIGIYTPPILNDLILEDIVKVIN